MRERICLMDPNHSPDDLVDAAQEEGIEMGKVIGRAQERIRIKDLLLKAQDGVGPEHSAYYALMEEIEKL